MIGALLAIGLAATRAPAPLVLGIDHVPLVVADLDRAKTDLAALGFALKPGPLMTTAFATPTSNSRTARRSS